jgi:hypothetical protein
MYIAYSALPNLNRQTEHQRHEEPENNLLIRYRAYVATCEKYHLEITAIQKYIPGWQPAFQVK